MDHAAKLGGRVHGASLTSPHDDPAARLGPRGEADPAAASLREGQTVQQFCGAPPPTPPHAREMPSGSPPKFRRQGHLPRIGGTFPLTLREMSEPFDECRLFLSELGGEMYGCLDLPASCGKKAFLRAGELLDVVHSSDGVDGEARRGR